MYNRKYVEEHTKRMYPNNGQLQLLGSPQYLQQAINRTNGELEGQRREKTNL